MQYYFYSKVPVPPFVKHGKGYEGKEEELLLCLLRSGMADALPQQLTRLAALFLLLHYKRPV